MAENRLSINIGATDNASGPLRTISRSMEDLQRQARGMMSPLAALQGAFAALGAVSVLKGAIDSALAMERLQRMMTAATGSASQAAAEFNRVREMSNRMGLDVATTAEGYGKFMAAVKGTSLQGEQAFKVFQSVSGATAALGLTTEQTSRVFVAMQQMMSKGKVSAEELTGQLGENLPGAQKMAADAMGMTTAELMKQIQQGKIMADDLLPKLAEQMDKTYGKAAVEGASTGTAAINKFKNSLLETSAALGDSLMPAFKAILNYAITPAVDMLKQFIVGFQILATKAATLPDKLGAGWSVIKSGKSPFFGAGQKMYEDMVKPFDKLADEQITDLMKKFTDGPASFLPAGAKSKPAKDDAAAKAASAAAESWRATLADLRSEITKLNPDLDKEEKALDAVDNKFADLLKKYPQHRSELLQLKQETRDMTQRNLDNAAALREQRDEIKATSDAFKDLQRQWESEPEEPPWRNYLTRDDLESQRDAVSGLKLALMDYADVASNAMLQTHDVTVNAIRGMEDALVAFAQTGKISFKSMVDSMIADIYRMAIQSNLTGPLAKWLQGGTAGSDISGWISGAASWVGGLSGSASSYQPGGYNFVGPTQNTTASGASSGAASNTGWGNSSIWAAIAAGVYSNASHYFATTWKEKSYKQRRQFNNMGLVRPMAGFVDWLTNGYLFGTGYKPRSSGLELSVDNGDMSALEYEVQKRKGSWFKGTMVRTLTFDIEKKLADDLSEQLGATLSGVTSGARAIGGSGDLSGFSYGTRWLQLSGLTGEQQQQKLAEYFSDVASAAIETLYPDIDQFSRYGETAGDTFQRLVDGLTTVNTFFRQIGITLKDLSLTGGAAADTLVRALGGLESATNAMAAYVNSSLFTDQERAQMTAVTAQAELARVFGELNLAVPVTAGEFKALLNGQLALGDSAATTAAELLKAAPVFASLLDAQSALLNDERSTLAQVLSDRRTALALELTAAQQATAAWSEAGSALLQASGTVRGVGLSPEATLASLRGQFAQSVEAVRGGNVTAVSTVTGLSAQLQAALSGYYGSSVQFQSESTALAATLDSLKLFSDQQVVGESARAAALQTQIDSLAAIDGRLSEVVLALTKTDTGTLLGKLSSIDSRLAEIESKARLEAAAA